MKLLKLAAAFTVLTTPVFAHGYHLGDLAVEHPYGFATPSGARVAGGFLTIENEGEADRLIAVETELGIERVELHTHVIDENGVAKMTELEDGIALPAGETVALQPGGLHVMFIGLGGTQLTVGAELPATLVFEKSGRLDVVFKYQARNGEGHGHDHSAHGADHGEGNDHALDHSDHSHMDHDKAQGESYGHSHSDGN